MQEAAISVNACFSLGLLEECKHDALPNKALSHILRIALTQHGVEDAPAIKWGVKCKCAHHDSHDGQCWWNVSYAWVYFFLETEFFHLFIHQMWVEGAFNRLSHNHCNSSADLMEAKLDGGIHVQHRDISTVISLSLPTK